MQNTISEHTTRRTLKQMGYSSRRPHRVPLLSAKNRKRRLRFAQAHQNWTIEDWKNVAWSDESRFLLRHSDDRVRIWRKEHESMDPSCLVSTVQAAGGGVMVWGIFSWQLWAPLYQHLVKFMPRTIKPVLKVQQCLYMYIYCIPACYVIDGCIAHQDNDSLRLMMHGATFWVMLPSAGKQVRHRAHDWSKISR